MQPKGALYAVCSCKTPCTITVTELGFFFNKSIAMPRLRHFLTFLLLSPVAAGLFGILHDQISYTIAPEYFTRFKFYQFQLLDPTIPERFRVAEIGFLASWWMGILLGLLSSLPAGLHKIPARFKAALFWSLPLMMGFTLFFALAGLGFGIWQTRQIALAHYGDWYLAPGVTDLRAYLCVGYMHNAAYLGGACAIPLGWLWHGIYWWRTRQRNQ